MPYFNHKVRETGRLVSPESHEKSSVILQREGRLQKETYCWTCSVATTKDVLQIGGWCAFPVRLVGCEQDADHRELYICTEKQLEGKVGYNALQRDLFSVLCKDVQTAFLYTVYFGDIGMRIYFAYVLTRSSVLHGELQAVC